MNILAIETSCDETAISIVKAASEAAPPIFEVLSDITLSQAKLHARYGGVFPNLAKREHAKNLIPLLKQALSEAKLSVHEAHTDTIPKKEIAHILEREPELYRQFMEYIPMIDRPEIDAIAVTEGPGLEPALWVGINFAKALALVWNVPIIPANHMEGHILSALISKEKDATYRVQDIAFPALALLISGGHTELVVMEDWRKYRIIGQTRDDAVGEAFDKVARILGLPYPGGPEISRLAEKAEAMKGTSKESPSFTLPRPMIHSDDFDFSFSGLKTAVLYTVKKLPELDERTKAAIALEFENAVTEVLIAKTFRAVDTFGIQTLIIGGGVSANKRIRKAFTQKAAEEGLALYLPDSTFSTDNALMIAVAGMTKLQAGEKGIAAQKLSAQGNLSL